MIKRVKIQVFPDGRIQAEVQGVKGKKCTDYIHILEELLQAKTVDSNYTAEYYENEILQVKTTQEINIEGKVK